MAKIYQFPYRTVAEIDIAQIIKNLAILRRQCRREIIPVVKADAYGHGLLPITKALIQQGSVELFAVATLEEAIEIRESFHSTAEIIILSGFLPHQIQAYKEYQLTPMIHQMNHLKAIVNFEFPLPFHLKVDTGMNRLGIRYDEVTPALDILKEKKVKLAGLATHFANSEEIDSGYIDEQLFRFEMVHNTLQESKVLATHARVHCANSAALFRLQKHPMITSVRPGLGLFGGLPNPNIEAKTQLKPSLNWKSRVIAFKEVKKGEAIGYGREHKSLKDERLAVVPVGYADGYPQRASQQGHVLIDDKPCPIRGLVSMDMMMVSCENLINCQEGASVMLLGSDKTKTISVHDLASWAGVVPYEIYCGISQRVPRIYFHAQAN